MVRCFFALRSATVLMLAAPLSAQSLQWAQNPANQRWYGVPFAPSSWTAGQALAVQQGGHLATIRNAAENTWISTAFTGVNSAGLWIGFNDIAVEGAFVWASGEPVTYTNWNPGEPNNGGGVSDAARLIPTSSWRWDDVDPASTAYTPLVDAARVPQAGWTLPRNSATQTTPASLATGDINGDGNADLVVPNTGSNSFTILRGDGTGGFPLVTHVPTAAGPTTVALADFDADGRLDVAVACLGGQRLRVHFQDAGGGFGTFVEVAHPGRGHGLAVADFDGDMLPDLAETTIETLDRLLIHRNLGNRAFAAPAVYATGSRPLHVTAGDLDGDGDVDLVVTNFDSDDVGLFFNTGSGTFLTSALMSRGNGPARAAIADVNGDGWSDLIIPERLDGLLKVFFGLGGGQFAPGYAVPAGVEPNWVVAADLDGDPFLDLAVAAFQSDAVVVYHGLGGGALTDPVMLRADDGATGLVAVDFNGDGRRDLATSGANAARVAVLLKLSRDCNGNGVDDPRDIALDTSADCNGNGEPDECDLAQGASFDCDANGAVDLCEIQANPTLDLDNDLVLDVCEVAGTPYCFGDSTGAACPCDPGQAGAPGTGCGNSIGSSGRLVAVGNPSVGADSVSLRVTGLLPVAVGLFFQGNNQQNAGLGSLFGDGLLCVNQSVIRLEIRTASGGAMAFGRDVPTDPAVSVDGLVPSAGATRYYQVWYRDAAVFCSANTYNLSNGVRIVWQP